MADKTARVPVRTYNVKDARGRILHWRAAVGAIEGTGDTEKAAIDDTTRILVNLATGLDRLRLVHGEEFGTAVIHPTSSGWAYTKLRIADGDGAPDERIWWGMSGGSGCDTAADAAAAAKAHAHVSLYRLCFACQEERRFDEMKYYTTFTGYNAPVCNVCLAGHGEEGALRNAANHMPSLEGDSATWHPMPAPGSEG